MRKYGDLYATVGTWVDDQGRKHKRKVRCSVVMQDDRSGRLAIRIEALPVIPDWFGWLAVENINDQDRAAP
jgi:hypothetical protein